MKMEERKKTAKTKRMAGANTQRTLGQIISRIESLIRKTKSSPVPRFDSDDVICGWDSSCENLYGYTAAEAVGQRLRDILQSDHAAEKFEQVLRGVLKNKNISPIQIQNIVRPVTQVSRRKSGIDIIGEIPWGTHFCQFYQTKQDLIDILVPYFKAGLENNEFCMWITCQPLLADEAKQALASQVKNVDEHIAKGQLEILDYTQWYTKSGRFESEKVLQGWLDKKLQALKKGFDGMRVAGNTAWIEAEQWDNFVAYEASICSVIDRYRILALCTYNIEKCDSTQMVDVVSNHQFALRRRNGSWEVVENSEHKQALEISRKSEERYGNLLEDISYGIAELDLTGRILFANKALYNIYGCNEGQLLGREIFELIAPQEEKSKLKMRLEELQLGQLLPMSYESKGLTKSGQTIDIEVRWDYKRDAWGRITGFIVSVNDIMQRKRIELLIGKKLIFEKVVSAISARFVNDTKVDEAISASVADIGMVTGAGSACIFLMRDGGAIMDNTHEWCGEGVTPQIENLQALSCDAFPWWMEKLKKGEIIHIEDVSKLPEEAAAEKKIFESQDIKSLVALPLNIGGELAGFIGLANTCRTGQWPKENIVLLRMSSVIIANAINRKNSRENLQKSKEWFRAIADYTCDLESWHGIDGRVLWVNPAVERLTGYTVQECMDMPDYPLPFVHGEDSEEIGRILKQAVEQQTTEDNLPLRIVRKDKTVRWMELSWQPIYNDVNSYIGIRTGMRDVTMQKLAEEALQESEGRYRSMINDVLDSSSVGICIVDSGCNIVWANSALEQYFGLSRSDIIGKDSRKLIQNKIKHIFEKPEDFAARVLAAYQNNTYSERFECHITYQPGRRERWLEHRSMPIRSGLYVGGRIEHYYDITDRKYAEENLHQSQQMLQLVLDSIPIRVFWKDHDLVFLGCNRAFVKDMDLRSQDEIIGKTDYELEQGIKEADANKQSSLRIIKSGIPEYHNIERIMRLNGDEKWLEINRIPLRNVAGSVVGILGAYEDITDRKQAEEEVQRLNRELEERVTKRTVELTMAHKHLLQEIKERKALEKEILEISEREKRLIGQELHDSIGQQFMGISFLAKVLEERLNTKLPEESQSAKAISDLVNQAIDQARALARGLHPVDLEGATLISSLRELLMSMESLFCINCTLTADNSILVANTDVAINLYRITQEAITNAIKHGKARNIHVELTNSFDRAFLIIKNDGKSFSEATDDSSGMGLRIMDHRAEMIGGSLNIRRNIGGGTVVTCCFPAIEADLYMEKDYDQRQTTEEKQRKQS